MRQSDSDCVIIIIIVIKTQVPAPYPGLRGGDHVVQHHAFIDTMIHCIVQQVIMLYHNQFS